jgi:hypothetical protein
MAGGPIHFSAQEDERCRIEGERHQLQSAGTKGCIRTPLEVGEVFRIDPGA